ncbi:unnamed protein product [Polarella glacialis]|uniref:N-acetyltransferase domain-containing protein n=1 Tax=Polarella glacialis TaxID=89957 RepID=A0A813HG00_POLGL|nr:unnamed protein product [Polarella glacialis]CAE8698710.1 unnamed protein product [Polarella glacialis]
MESCDAIAGCGRPACKMLDGDVEFLSTASGTTEGCHPGGLQTKWVVKETRDRELLQAYLSICPEVQTYALGDLAPPHWDHCRWHVLCDLLGCVHAVALTYTGLTTPVLQVLADPREDHCLAAAASLLRSLAVHHLPGLGAFECHVNAGLQDLLLEAGFSLAVRPHQRLALPRDCLRRLCPVDDANQTETEAGKQDMRPVGHTAPPTDLATRLGPADAEAAAALCATMPRSWFEPKVLQEGRYLGIWQEGRLASMGGTHVFAPEYGVAALGNVGTDTDFRGRGLGKALVHQLCCHLCQEGIQVVSLNVESDNEPALRLYKSLGFSTVMDFVECDVIRT